ncbi:MAG: SsrA-binding protein SmpB [Myxococcota bacterium]
MAKATAENKKKTADRDVVVNRRARFDYEVEDTFEAGMVLQGTEVKSLRNGGGELSDAYVLIKNGEAFLIGMKISPYTQGNIMNHVVDRTRKLLLHEREIHQLEQESQRGMQLVPLRVYFKGGRAKTEVGVGKPRKAYDKRGVIKEREVKRELARARRGDDE